MWVIMVVIALCFVGILVRVGMLQTTQEDVYEKFASIQRERNEIIPAPRGEVLDRNGKPLALSVAAKSIYADPRAVVDPGKTVVVLGRVLALSAARQKELLTQLSVPDRSFVYVARQVEPETALVVENLQLPGIGTQDEIRRHLPNGDVARGLVGQANVDGVGSAGLEKQYDEVLTGRPGQLRYTRGTKGRSIPSSQKALIDAVPGSDVVLTIDLALQYQVERALTAKVEELKARGGSAIVMDSRTGEVYAMASVRRDAETGIVRVGAANYAAVDSYEPGSVAKVITVAGALNDKKVQTSTAFMVPDRKMFWDEWLHDAESHPTMPMTVQEILAKSSNIGTIFISQTLGPDKQEAYMRAFGFGAETALDFPGESKGILHPNSRWRGTENVTVSYGQGVSATAIQLVSAVNVIANDGVYVAPKLVKSMKRAGGVVENTMPSATRRVVSSEVARQMNMLMRDVVCVGTARGWAGISGYTIAGKTGTGYKAQKNGTYFDDEGRRAYYASFVGFLPAEDPRITVLVSIDEPPPGAQHFGANTAAPVFNKIARAAIVDLGIQAPNGSGGCPTPTKAKG
jgi:cell division protein FtsI (penicillin-binding protein 3)